MIRRGYIGPYTQRYFRNLLITDSGNSSDNPNIPPDQGGSGGDVNQFDFLTTVAGRGYNLETEKLLELVFLSTVLTKSDGRTYRFFQLMRANTYYTYDEDGDIDGEYLESIDTHVGIVICTTTGRLGGLVSSGNSYWTSDNIGDNGVSYVGYDLYFSRQSDRLDATWDNITSHLPVADADIVEIIKGPESGVLYDKATEGELSSQADTETIRARYGGPQLLNKPAVFWNDPTTTNEIVTRAMSKSNYKYWYGGKGEIANIALANSLRAGAYTRSVWTQEYYNLAITYIDGSTRVGDCSYLVCYAYNIPMIGSSQLASQYPVYNGIPKNGMILWRPGHVAIYNNGTSIQLESLKTGFQVRPYTASAFRSTHYDTRRAY